MKRGCFKFTPYWVFVDAVCKEARPGVKAGNELIDENNNNYCNKKKIFQMHYDKKIGFQIEDDENKILEYLMKYFQKMKPGKNKSLEKVVGFR